MTNAVRTIGGVTPATLTVQYGWEFIRMKFSRHDLDEDTAARLAAINGKVVGAEISPIPTATSQFVVLVNGVRLEFVVATEREIKYFNYLCGRKELILIMYGPDDGFFECVFA